MKGRILTDKQIAAFAVYLKSEEKSENTVEKYIRDVRAFAAYVGVAEMFKETVIGYKNKLVSENYAARSINSMLASINSLLSFLGWADLKVKSIKLQRQIYCPEEKELTKAEYMRLVHTAKQKGNERLNLLIQTICGTGIRVSELQYITVEAVKCGEAVVSLKGKTRSVFIVRELQKKLLRYAAEQKITSGVIFITRNGKPMSRTNIWREMKSLCEQAGVNPQKVFPHNLRHLFARTFYGIEKDIAKLADIIKEKLRIKYYSRYMDDCILIHHDKDYLKHCLKQMKQCAEELKIDFNEKTEIFPIKNGVDYLGWHIYLTESGKVIRKVKQQTKYKYKRKLKYFQTAYQDGNIELEEINQVLSSYRAHLAYGHTYKLQKKILGHFVLRRSNNGD